MGSGKADALPIATCALAQVVARAIAQQMTHGARRVGEKLCRVGEGQFALRADAQVQLMHQRGRIERTALVSGELPAGHGFKACIDRIEQCVR